VSQPAVSIIVAMRNSAAHVRAALDSIAAQSVADYEVIVVDGASVDDGPAIARSYPRTVCLQQPGSGLANAWNCGIVAARAPFIAFLDSDDLWTPAVLETHLATFGRESAVEHVCGRTEFFLEPGQQLPRGFRPELLQGSHLALMTGSSMIRRAAVERLGPFDEGMRIAFDIAWLMRLRKTSIARTVDAVFLRKRLHADSLGQATPWSVFRAELLQVARRSALEQAAAER
jgi:glycosyltransferase involved in cell wall biosynthesis